MSGNPFVSNAFFTSSNARVASQLKIHPGAHPDPNAYMMRQFGYSAAQVSGMRGGHTASPLLHTSRDPDYWPKTEYQAKQLLQQVYMRDELQGGDPPGGMFSFDREDGSTVLVPLGS